MADLFRRVATNRTALMIAGGALLIGGAALMIQRYRNSPQRITGHWIGNEPVMPSHIPSGSSEQQRTAMSDYLLNTHMNMQHQNMETVQRRATAFSQWGGAEANILANTKAALSDFRTPHFQMSSHMVHNERRILADRANHLRETVPETASTKLSEEVTKMTTVRSQGVGPAYNELTDMMIHGKKGPLTVEQSALGIEATIVGHHVLDKTSQYAKTNPRMQATRPIDLETSSPSHPTTSPHGMDLSKDPGTQLREELGLPVMTGTSGSASDVIRSYGFTLAELSHKIPEGQFMDASKHRDLLYDLSFNWMRSGAPMTGVRGLISDHQTKQKFKKISTPSPTATQTHSFPEIAAGVDLTLDGNTPDNLRKSTHNALAIMKQNHEQRS